MAVQDSDEDFSKIDLYDDELVKIQRYEIYKIASRPTVLPVTDMVQWVATHVDFCHLAIVADNRKVLGFLMPENFQSIYHLKPAEVKCNKEYLDNFYIANPKAHMLMNPWYQEEEYFKDRAGNSKYNTIPFIPSIQYLTTMLSRLHGEADCMFFKSGWSPWGYVHGYNIQLGKHLTR